MWTEDEVVRAIKKCRDLPHGATRIATAEEAARHAETDGHEKHLAWALLTVIEAYTFGREGWRSFAVMSKLTRLADERPELLDQDDLRNLLWEMKWVATDLGHYPQVRLEHATAFLDDMRRRSRLAGYSETSTGMSVFQFSWLAGLDDVEQRRLEWLAMPQDDLEDCEACVIAKQVSYFLQHGRNEEAIALGRQIHTSCNLEPTYTLHALALAEFRVGLLDDAMVTYARARATYDDTDSDFAPSHGQAFEMFARGGHLDRALAELKSEHAGLLIGAESPLWHLRFLLGVLAGLSANRDRFSRPFVLTTPPVATVGELHSWVLAKATELAEAFDRRGETDFYAGRIAQSLAATRSAQDLPVAVVTTSAPRGATESSHRAETVAADSTAPRDDWIITDGSEGPSLARAEKLAAGGAWIPAAQEYLAAAAACEDEGYLDEAGRAWAEAAQCAVHGSDNAGAHDAFSRAVPLLRAGEADPELVAQVLAAWAPVAVAAGRGSEVVAHIADLRSRSGPGSVARAELDDSYARLIAELRNTHQNAGGSLDDAVSAGMSAGESFAHAGRVFDAAHSFWLVGRLEKARGRTGDAVFALESAFEGFGIAHHREPRVAVADELIQVYRELGQDEKVEALLATLRT